MNSSPISIKIRYFASLRDARGLSAEHKTIAVANAHDLYCELQGAYKFRLDPSEVRVAINGNFASMQTQLCQGDELAFIPPVSGG
jgi:molybdopterin synthase sulfur carrier subunit